MAIQMRPEVFPEERREDPKRRAEARVFDALHNLERHGNGIYEFRYREEGRQLDFALWVDELGRFALQVKGGNYRMDNSGRWYLIAPNGDWTPVSSPLEETEDGCIEMHNAIGQAAHVYGFVAPVLVLPDMEPDEQIECSARNHRHVSIIWGLDNLQQDLESIARQVPLNHPPKSQVLGERGPPRLRAAAPGSRRRRPAGRGPPGTGRPTATAG